MARTLFVAISILASLGTVVWGAYWPNAYWLFILILPFIALGLYDMAQRRHTILRIYPVIGHLRFMFESIRPEIQHILSNPIPTASRLAGNSEIWFINALKGNSIRARLARCLMFIAMASSGSTIL